MQKNDPFAKVREQAQRALDLVLTEIRRREFELEQLVQQAEHWRAALANTKPNSAKSPARRKAAKTVSREARRPGGKRISWDDVLKGLPAKFSVDDVLKRPGVKARGRAQIYPAITRWMEAKKVKRVGKGKYRKA